MISDFIIMFGGNSHEEILSFICDRAAKDKDAENKDEPHGPVGRNILLLRVYEEKLENSIHDYIDEEKDKKNVQKTLKMMITEFKENAAKDIVDGIALIHVRFTRLIKGTGLLFFHGGVFFCWK